MAADIEAVRDWVGATPDDAAITVAWDRFDGETHQAEWTALSILRRKRQAIIEGPERWGVEADYNEAIGKAVTLKELASDIGRLERITGDTAGVAANVLTSAPICAPEGLR